MSTFQWLSPSQSGLDAASLGDVQVVVVDGKRVPVYVQPAVVKARTLAEIRDLAERKIEDAASWCSSRRSSPARPWANTV